METHLKVLLIGGGGREHALGWKLAQSSALTKLYLIPGNPGLEQISQTFVETLPIKDSDIAAIADAAIANGVDLVVVGPEAPLAEGLGDRLGEAGIACFGPSSQAAQLESSKGFMKDLCKRHAIPTAQYERFSNPQSAKAGLDRYAPPYVIKADGLAAGKGVIIAETKEQAVSAIETMMDGQFGDAGAQIVIEEFLEGEEASFFVICDGENALPMMAVQDHKRVGEGDTGPNTGGMGAYGPAPVFNETIKKQTLDQIIEPTLKGMASEGMPFCGVLFAGLMITKDGPKLIEYNVRFGDPECQVMMRLMKSDFLPILDAAAKGALEGQDIEWSKEFAALVVMAAQGYPGDYEKGSAIHGIEKAGALDEIVVFHAGTKMQSGQLVANGGRVLNITATGPTIVEALERTYEAVDLVDWPEGFCRRDIGWRAR